MIFTNNIKRILRDKLNTIFMFVVPIVFIVLTMQMNSKVWKVTVGIVDNDNTEFTEIIKDKIEENGQYIEIQEGDIQKDLIESNVDYVLSIDKGFTEKLINGEDVSLKGYGIKETNASMPFKIYMESFLNSSKDIAKAADKSSSKFYEAMEYYKNGGLSAEYLTVGANKTKKTSTISGIGFLIMGMLLFSGNVSTLPLEDKKSGTYYRMFAAPLSTRSYMVQNILSYFVFLSLQIVVIFAILLNVFDADFGPSVPRMLLLLFIFAVVCTAFGTAISSVSKDRGQASVISNLLVTPMCMLGGCFWPREIMPDVLKRVGDFVPTTWALNGAYKLINGNTLKDISLEISILLLFALIFFLIAAKKKIDVYK